MRQFKVGDLVDINKEGLEGAIEDEYRKIYSRYSGSFARSKTRNKIIEIEERGIMYRLEGGNWWAPMWLELSSPIRYKKENL